jgi:hypothetical protein
VAKELVTEVSVSKIKKPCTSEKYMVLIHKTPV